MPEMATQTGKDTFLPAPTPNTEDQIHGLLYLGYPSTVTLLPAPDSSLRKENNEIVLHKGNRV